MAASINSQFHSELAEKLINGIQYQKNNYYYFLGKVFPWANVGDTPIDTIETLDNEKEIRKEIVVTKKIRPSDVSLSTKRIDWVAGEIYDQWDSTVDMRDKRFYVLTDEFNVYKCLDNKYNRASLNKPTSLSLSPFSTSDGYVWKYMYTIPPTKRSRFLSPLNMPTQVAITDRFYNNGSVDEILITNSGSGYVENIRVAIIISDTAGGTGAYLYPVVDNNGAIVDVKVINKGSNYGNMSTVYLEAQSYDGSGADAVLEPVIVNGQIQSVRILNGGSGYPKNSSNLQFDIDGDGVGLEIAPVVNGETNQIEDIVIINSGEGYNFANITLTDLDNIGSGATFKAVLTQSDLSTEQSKVEQVAIDGAIHKIQITNQGSDYTNATISITGDGVGATGTPIIVEGKIVDVLITNPGSGYSYANVLFFGDNTNNNPNAVMATGYCILPPFGGHGRDANSELFADTIALYSLIRNTEVDDDFSFSQEFRQFGIISDPRDLTEGRILRTEEPNNLYKVELSSLLSDTLSQDQIISKNNAKFRVISRNGNNFLLSQLTKLPLTIDDTLVSGFDNTSYRVMSVLASPVLDKYSGKLLITSNDSSFSFNDEQNLILNTFIKL